MKKILLILFISLCSFNLFAQKKAVRTITNADLEKYRVEREKNEAADEAYRKKNGLPTLAQQAEINAREQAELRAVSRKLSTERQQNEAYWQSRAYPLRTEIASVNAQINYLVAAINRLPQRQNIYAVGYAAPQIYYPNQFPNQYAVHPRQPQYARSPNAPSAINFPTQALPPNGVTATVGGNFGRIYGQINYGYGYNYYPNYAVPVYVQNESYERQDLVARLRYLEQQRVGLNARWNELEEEARQNGADYNWLQ